MSNAFNKMLKSQKTNFDDLTKKLSQASKGRSSYKDERIWTLTRDEHNNGYAVIRFLPTSKKSELPVVTVIQHFFRGPTNDVYAEKSLVTIGQADPVAELNKDLWDNHGETGKDQARRQKRSTNYYSNILVIKDPACPENEGKVFLYRYGKSIMQMLSDLMVPDYDDEDPVNPYDFIEGCDFKLKSRDKANFVNYEKSSFSAPAALFDGDVEKLEEVWNKQYELDELIAPAQFKTYDELKTKLYKVLHITDSDTSPREKQEERPAPKERKPVDTSAKPDFSSKTEENTPPKDWDGDGDDMSYFQNLVDSD